MKFREIKFYEKASVAFGISAIISIPTTKFYCSTRCSGIVPFAKLIIRIYAHKILTRLISNHSDIRAYFIVRLDCANLKLLLFAQTERLVQIKFRWIYRSLCCVNLKSRSHHPALFGRRGALFIQRRTWI